VVNGKFLIVDGAIPNFVVALSGSIVPALVLMQNIFDPIGVARHLGRFRQANALLPLLCIAVKTERWVDWHARIGWTII
jgi:hypothetical protein